MSDQIDYRVLSYTDTDDVISMFVDVLIHDEPQCRSLGVTHPRDTGKLIEAVHVVPIVVSNGLSVGAFDASTGEMVGLRSTVTKNISTPRPKLFDITNPKEEKFAKIDMLNVFMYEGCDVFHITGCDDVIHFYGLMVKATHRRQGIGRRLVETAIDVAKAKGYRAVVCEATSNYSRRIFERVGFRLLKTVRFDDFMIDGHVVFRDTGPHELCTLHALNI